MPAKSAVESAGKQDLEKLKGLIRDRWDSVSIADRELLGVPSAERLIWRVVRDLQLLGRRSRIRIPRKSVAERFKRQELPHLKPDGPAAEREALGLGPSDLVLAWPSLDRRKDALSYGKHSFSLRQLDALRATADRLHGDLERLRTTPLASQMSESDRTRLQRFSRELSWCSKHSLPSFVDQARAIGARKAIDSRRIVVQMITDVERVTGKKSLEMWSTILNWRAPQRSWTAQLLQRWLTDAATVKRSRSEKSK